MKKLLLTIVTFALTLIAAPCDAQIGIGPAIKAHNPYREPSGLGPKIEVEPPPGHVPPAKKTAERLKDLQAEKVKLLRQVLEDEADVARWESEVRRRPESLVAPIALRTARQTLATRQSQLRDVDAEIHRLLMSRALDQSKVQLPKAQSFRFVNIHSGKALSIVGGSTENGVRLTQTSPASDEAQEWILAKTIDFYLLINRKSQKVVDVPGDSTDEGVSLIQWHNNGQANQHWILERVGDHFSIKSRSSGLVLDVAGESREDGAAILQWRFHGNANQLWRLVPVPGR